VNGKRVAEERLEQTVPIRFSSYAGLDIGKDNGEVVSPTYRSKAPFAFTGKIGKVVFDLAPGQKDARDQQKILQERMIRAMGN
jgi:hypothetical protein